MQRTEPLEGDFVLFTEPAHKARSGFVMDSDAVKGAPPAMRQVRISPTCWPSSSPPPLCPVAIMRWTGPRMIWIVGPDDGEPVR